MAKKYIADNIDLASDLSMASSSSGEQKIVIGNTDGAQTTNDYSKIHLTGKSDISSSLVGAEINLNTGGAGVARVNFNSSFSYSNTGSYKNAKIGYVGGNNDDFYVQQIDGSTASNNAGFIITTADVRLIGDGIKIGGTATANRLDDYEEGTYNLQFRLFKISTTTSSITVTSSDFGYFLNDSTYTKIGNKVTLYIDLKYYNPTNSNWTTATTWYLGLHNLPFAVKDAGTSYTGAVGGTYDFFSSFHMDANTGNNFFMSKGGYSNYDNAIAFKSASNTINYGWRPLFSSEAPTYYNPSSGTVHLTGVITYSTDV